MTGLENIIGESEEKAEDESIVAIVQWKGSIKEQVMRAKVMNDAMR